MARLNRSFSNQSGTSISCCWKNTKKPSQTPSKPSPSPSPSLLSGTTTIPHPTTTTTTTSSSSSSAAASATSRVRVSATLSCPSRTEGGATSSPARLVRCHAVRRDFFEDWNFERLCSFVRSMLHTPMKLEGCNKIWNTCHQKMMEYFMYTRSTSEYRHSQNYEQCCKQQQRLRSLVIIRYKKMEEDTSSKLPSNRQSPLGVFHSKGDVIAGSYKIIGILGQGGVATTYKAINNGGEVVALKAMSLRSMKGWKDLDLFEREARVLRSLRHPGIPEYIDSFEIDSDVDRAFYIAQKVAEGSSLASLIESGWRATEKEIERIAIEILEILQYLGSLRPPVVHRDVKPENIILDESSGKVELVDFGAVQDAAAVTLIGSTVVGTYGYMAPEQFQNRATVQSDLYGLGCTILFLLSGRPPSSFPQKRLKIDFQDSVVMDQKLKTVLERLLEPAPEDRFQSAAEVIEALKKGLRNPMITNKVMERKTPNQRIRQPSGTSVVLNRTDLSLTIKIPAPGFTSDSFGTGTFAVAWNAFVMFWTRSAVTGGAPLFFALFSLPFWVVGVRLAKESLFNFAVSVEIQISMSQFFIQWELGNIFKQRIEGKTKDIDSIKIAVEGLRNGRVISACQITEGKKQHKFGYGLEILELDWLVQEIGEFLEFGAPKLGEASRSTVKPSLWSNDNGK